MSNQPWMKFYPRDWRGDQALRAVSLAARGLWMECLCIMHEANPYGSLLLNGNPISTETLSRMIGAREDDVVRCLDELVTAGVASQNRAGVIFSRRMQKDRSRAEKGRKSVEKRWSQAPEKQSENSTPISYPSTQKPEARSQRAEEGSDLRSSPSPRSVAPPELPLSSDPPSLALIPPNAPASAAGPSVDDDFEEFWRNFPGRNRMAKAPAKSNYVKARRKTDAAAILAGAMRYAAWLDAQPPDTKVKHAQGWLTEERWNTPYTIDRARPGAGQRAYDAALYGATKTKEFF